MVYCSLPSVISNRYLDCDRPDTFSLWPCKAVNEQYNSAIQS